MRVELSAAARQRARAPRAKAMEPPVPEPEPAPGGAPAPAPTPGGAAQASWERAAAALVRDFSGSRSIQLIDPLLRTRWFWPREGNEDAPSYNHGSNPLRRGAIMAPISE